MMKSSTIAPDRDLWDPIYSLQEYGRHMLTSVELTVTNACNMRCEHCAVGEALTHLEPERLPLEQIFKRLDEVEHLKTLSITGGEPSFHRDTLLGYVLPILKYAKQRGLMTQINTNLTLEYERYEAIAPYVDVMHISFNYTGAEDFHQIGFARSAHPVSFAAAEKMYTRMIENARKLSKAGTFVSAESMINYRTHEKIAQIHHLIADMGCRRHEVHPMYPSDFARDLPLLSLAELRRSIHRLLDDKHPDVWVLFGTLPFYHCNADEEDQRLLTRLKTMDNVTVRNDPDGRNRLNIDVFTGKVYVTDFAELSAIGDIRKESLSAVFERWLEHPVFRQVHCHCPEVQCTGPNWLVKEMYYKHVDFSQRKAQPMGITN